PVRAPGIERERRAPRALEGEPEPVGSPTRSGGYPPAAGGEPLPSDVRRPPAPPLAGVGVLDFGWAVAGPVTTRHLGLLGATVIKVETNTRLDTTRASTPFVGRPSRDRSGYFATHNNNKLSLTLDLNKPASR